MSFVIPSNNKDRQIINDCLKEIGNHLTIKSAADDAIKDIRDRLGEDYEMSARTANRLAKTMYKQDFQDKADDFEEFHSEFEMLVKGVK